MNRQHSTIRTVCGCGPPLVLLALTLAGCDSGTTAVAPDATTAPVPAPTPPTARDPASARQHAVANEPSQQDEYGAARGPAGRFADSAAAVIFDDAQRERRRGQNEEAERLYRQAVEIDPTHSDAWRGLIEILLERDDDEGAAEACDGLLATLVAPPREEASHNLQCAATHRRIGAFETAVTYGERAVELEGTRLEPRLALSGILLEANRPDDVVTLLEGQVQTIGGPLEAAALSNLGSAYVALGRNADAVTVLGHANEITPDRVDVLLNLAEAQQRAGQAEAARQTWTRVLEIDPSNERARQRLGG